ncbi:MAG TPA: hypothetical protein VFO34_14780 [Candidatus Acidoferrales bacterium]|nr:hypothetical protein [Candidatus Acidoferrales bacterium]
MNCAEFNELVHSLVRYELLDIDLRERALLHADSCASCAARLGNAQALADATEFAGTAVCTEKAPVRVAAAVFGEYRRIHRPRHVGTQVAKWALAAAATFALAFGGWFGYSRWQSNDRVASPAPARVNRNPVEANNSSTANPAAQDANATSADSNLLADFEPVPFADDFDSGDPAMIVHVQLTRAALGKLGYQVEKGKGKELVNADVLVGVDGWPRAVRVVQ